MTFLWARFCFDKPKNRGPEKMLILKHDQPRKAHHTVGSITRPGIDQNGEETLACCDFRFVHAGIRRERIAIAIMSSDTRAMETLLAQLSHLLGFNIEHKCFFVGIPYLETRTVECKTTFRVTRSNKIMCGVRQEDVEAFNTSHKIKVQMLLHSVGTHPAEEQYWKFAANLRRCAEQHELRNPELCSSRRHAGGRSCVRCWITRRLHDFVHCVVVPTRFAAIPAPGTLAQHTLSRTHSFGSAKRSLSSSVQSSGRHG